MTEKYLHFIWKNKRLNSFEFVTQQNENIQIIDVGIYNELKSGPDFKHGVIIIDGIEMHGQIEMHVKSSDWIKHKHNIDEQYNNVILHVVYENDEQIVQNGTRIPTIELKNVIDKKHFAQYIKNQFKLLDFPCGYSLSDVDKFFLNSMKITALSIKLDQKIELINKLGLKTEEEVLYNLLGLAFSMSINKNAFLHLMNNVPYSSIAKLARSKKIQLIMTESGILQKNMSEPSEIWHYKGLRPSSFPEVRVSQFALLVTHFSFELEFLNRDANSVIEVFKLMIGRIDFSASNGKRSLSKKMVDSLMINALVPFLWYVGNKKDDEKLKEKEMDILERLPSENNRIIQRWKKIGIIPKNAFDSQSLLALYRYFCNSKKCLSCSVGQKVLNLKQYDTKSSLLF